MRHIRPALALALVVIAALLSGIPLFHAHDTSAPGIYNSWCALCDLGGQVAAPPLSIPQAVRLAVTVAPAPAAADGVVLTVAAEPPSSRAPPQP